MNEAPTSKVMTSTFLWIVALFVVANLTWGLLRPLQAVPHTAQPNLELSKAALRYKMDKLTKSKSADFMIVGSSLPMCAFFYTERPPFFDLKEGDRIRSLKLNLLQSYPEAGYFQNKLKELSNKDFTVFNFAGAACMVSDSKLVIERAIAANKAPKALIYGLGLRDFVDNVNPPPGETPYYKALCNAQYLLGHISELAHFPSFSDLSVAALCKLYDLRNEFRISAEHVACKTFHHPSSIELAFILGDLNKKLAAPPPAVNVPESNQANVAGAQAAKSAAPVKVAGEQVAKSADPVKLAGEQVVKSADPVKVAGEQVVKSADPVKVAGAQVVKSTDLAKVAGARVAKSADPAKAEGDPSRSLGAPPSKRHISAKVNQDLFSSTPSSEPPLATLDYQQRYTPANYKRLQSEMEQLQEVIALCKKHNIQLILINMPVSEGHKTLSPAGLREAYLSELRRVGPTASLFIDCENMHLPNSSFFDTVHLNGTGSVQFVDFLSEKLRDSGYLK